MGRIHPLPLLVPCFGCNAGGIEYEEALEKILTDLRSIQLAAGAFVPADPCRAELTQCAVMWGFTKEAFLKVDGKRWTRVAVEAGTG